MPHPKETVFTPTDIQETIPGLEPQKTREEILQEMSYPLRAVPEALDENAKFFRAGQSVYAMMDDLIATCPDISHLHEFPVSLIFKRAGKRARKEGTRFTAGEARKMSPKEQLYHGFTFEVWLDETVWCGYPDKRLPLLHHELMHCGINEEGEPVMRDHDVTEFREIVRRHGLWDSGLEAFMDSIPN